MLDEPTNHLDIYSIRWLEKFLQGYRGVVIVVSHDRRFLQNTCTDILDIDYQTITHYPKAYDQAHLMKASWREQWEKERERKEKEIADKQAFVDRFKAKATKARQAQSRVKQLEKSPWKIYPRASIARPILRSHWRVKQAKISCVSKGYKTFGPKTVLKDVSFNIRKGDRVAIVGANGIGKSTLLKILAEKFSKTAAPLNGEPLFRLVTFHRTCRIASTPKHRYSRRYGGTTQPRRASCSRHSGRRAVYSRRCLSPDREACGEAARTILSILTVQEPNVLLIDEPTNHMDVETADALATLLNNYKGSVILVSHDRTFRAASLRRSLKYALIVLAV